VKHPKQEGASPEKFAGPQLFPVNMAKPHTHQATGCLEAFEILTRQPCGPGGLQENAGG